MDDIREAHRRLGVKLSSTDDEIKNAFRKAAFEMHPDRAKVSERASTHGFKEMQQALDIIRAYRANRLIAHRLQEAENANLNNGASAHHRSRHTPASGPMAASARVRRPGVAVTLIGSALLFSAGLYLGMLKYRWSKRVIERRLS